MIVGESGGGKTTALATFPPSWKVLDLDFFGNKESLEGCPNVEIISYSDWDPSDPQAVIDMQKDKDEILELLANDEFPYQVICIDTVTGILRFMENHILYMHPDKKGIGGAPAQHHYRGLAHMSANFIMSFVGLPLTVVINTHAELQKDDYSGMFRYQAIISGARLRNTIYSYVGEVYRAFGEPSEKVDEETGEPTTDYFWQTQPDSQWPMLKSVMNQKGANLWGKYVEPNYETLLKKRGLVK